MTFYTDMAFTAQELLNEFGQLVTLTRYSTTYDPATSDNAVSLDVSATGAGAVIDYRLGEFDGTLVLATDERLLLSSRAQGGVPMPEPMPGDTVYLHAADKTLRVVSSKPLAPAGAQVLHDVQLRA